MTRLEKLEQNIKTLQRDLKCCKREEVICLNTATPAFTPVDPFNPTTDEVQAWVEANLTTCQQNGGTHISYFLPAYNEDTEINLEVTVDPLAETIITSFIVNGDELIVDPITVIDSDPLFVYTDELLLLFAAWLLLHPEVEATFDDTDLVNGNITITDIFSDLTITIGYTYDGDPLETTDTVLMTEAVGTCEDPLFVWVLSQDGNITRVEYFSEAFIVDRFNDNIIGTDVYNPALPLTNWTAPAAPTLGNTATVKFSDGTIVTYTYNGVTWVVDFTDEWFEERICLNTSVPALVPADPSLPTFAEVQAWAVANLTIKQRQNGTNLVWFITGDGGDCDNPDYTWTLNKGSQLVSRNQNTIITVPDYTTLRSITKYNHDVINVADWTYTGPDGNDYTTLGGVFRKTTGKTENGGTVIESADGIIWERDDEDFIRPEFFGSGLPIDRINAAINTYRNVLIGDSIDDIYIIDAPILPHDNSTLIINGTIITKSQSAITLAQNVTDNDTSITVPNGALFRAGQYVVVSDNNAAVQGGGTQTRRVGGVVKINSVVGNVLNTTPIQGSYTVAASAYIAITTNIILVEDKEGVTIRGKGILDGDWTNQVDFEGIAPNGMVSVEETRSQCGVTFFSSTNCEVYGITIKNNPLHNITGWNSDFIKVIDVTLLDAHDKNFLVFGTDSTDYYVSNLYINGSVFEDGLAFYTGPKKSFINNVHILNCPRYGLINEADSTHNVYSNIIVEGCKTGVAILGSYNSLNGLKILDSELCSLLIQDETALSPLQGITVQGLLIDTQGNLGSGVVVNSVENSSISDFNVYNIINNGYALNVNTNSRYINISNGVIKDCYRGYLTSGGALDITLTNVALINPTVTTVEDIATTRMINCAGFRDPIMFNQDIYTNQKIGIGTKDPAVSLHIVNGNAYLIGTNSTILVGDDTSTQYGGVRFNSAANSTQIFNGVTNVVTAKASGDITLNGYVEFTQIHANHGATVANGSIWLATDGLFYKKNGAGVVTLL